MRRCVAIFVVLFFTFQSTVLADVSLGDKGAEVKQVQEHLKWFGYTITIDGKFGLQTDRAVRHWQRSNGLVDDGIVGSITADSMGIRGASIQITEPPKSPGGLSGCDEMSWYRQQAGLPDVFDSIGFRESRCQNDARPSLPAASCCRGWWAIHRSNIRAPGYAAGAAACGITSESDYYGTSRDQKRASACFARVLYDVSGMTPWAV